MSNSYKEDGNRFHRKLARLIKNAGFNIISSDVNQKGPDIAVEFENKRIIIQCRYSSNGSYYQKLEDDVDSYSHKIKKYNADIAVLAIAGYSNKLDFNRLDEWLKNDKVAVWTDQIINNYTSLVNSVGTYAKYQILADLGIDSNKNEILSIDVLEVNQHNTKFYLTKLDPETLLRISGVARIAQKKNFYQRYLSKKRVKKEIPDYIEHEKGLFPNSIILASNRKLSPKNGRLNLPLKFGLFWVIDGQHRLYSFCNLKDRDILNDYELPCTIFDGTKIKPIDQARIFERINSRAKKTPASLITELASTFGFEDDREMYLLQKLEKTPYFNNKIRHYPSLKGTIDARTFIGCSAVKELVRDGGIILNGRSNLSDEQKKKRCYSYLYSFFKIINNNLRKEWNRPKTYILCTNQGYRSLLRLFIKILKYTYGRHSESTFREIIKYFKNSNPLIKIDDITGKYAGEGGASKLADEWARGINKVFPSFDKSIQQHYGVEIKRERITKGELSKAENFLQENSKLLRGVIRAEFAFVDYTTIGYLERYFSHCTEFNIVFSKMRPEDKAKIDQKKLEMNEKNIKLILTKCEKIHERWIGDDKHSIELKVDLKKDALANSDHEMCVFELDGKQKIEEFDKRWNDYKKYENRNIIFDWSASKEVPQK